MLDDVWPSDEELAEALSAITPDMFRQRYADAMSEPRWDSIPAESSPLYPWEDDSTYIRLPTFFSGLSPEPSPIAPIEDAKVLLKLGDSITTDHISPPGLSQRADLQANGLLKEALMSEISTHLAVEEAIMKL